MAGDLIGNPHHEADKGEGDDERIIGDDLVEEFH
jgi:hypothetical protein